MSRNPKEIIENYKPTPGFYDLSTTPKTMSIEDHANLIELQQGVINNSRILDTEEKRNLNSRTWEKTLNVSAMISVIYHQHWV